MIHKNLVLRLIGVSMVALAVAPWVSATPAAAGNNSSGSPGDHKVTICHRTNADTNSYVVITVDTDAAGGGKDSGAGDHAAEHQGPLWNATLKANHIEWGDIIPPYVDDQGVVFPGYNWSAAGQAIYANDCRAVTPPTTTSAPVTTTSGPVTTTSAPVTTTSSAAVTTTASVQVTTTTAAAPGATTTSASASVLPAKVGKTTTPAGAASSSAEVLGAQAGALPKMGTPLSLVWTLALSLALILAGTALMVLPGRLAIERNRRH